MSDTPKITPALTAEQWKERIADGVVDLPRYLTDDDRHWVAALALYGQPYGFTWEDVVKLRAIANTIHGEGAPTTAARVMDIAARIAALLPPRTNS